MNKIRQILRQATRRLHLNAFVASLHQVAIIAAASILLIAIIDKTTEAFTIPWLWVGSAIGALALLATTLIWSTHRRNELQVAVEVDDRLDLREKLSTALHLRDRTDTFARAAIDDAVHVAREPQTRERVGRLFPIESPRRWWTSPLILALAVIAALFLPQGNWFAGDEEDQLASSEVPAEVQQAFETTIEQVKQTNIEDEQLKDLMKDLDPDKFDPNALKNPEDAKREALKRLTAVSEKLKDILENQNSKATETLEKQLRQLRSKSGPAEKLTEALARSDFQEAKKALEGIRAKAEDGSLTPEQKEELSEQLDELGKQLEQIANQKRELEKALQEAGLDKNLANDMKKLQQAIQQNQNLNQQQKQQLQQMAQAQQMANQMCQGLGQGMQQMAQAMQNGQMGGQPGDMQGMLDQMQQMQDMLQQAKNLAQCVGGQCQGLGEGLGQGQMQGWMQQLAQGQGGMGPKAGQGRGGEAEKSRTPTQTSMKKANAKEQDADVIASVLFEGQQIKGESSVDYRNVVRSAKESYADHVEDNQVPARYHEAIKKFYGEEGLGGKAPPTSESGQSGESGDASSSIESAGSSEENAG